MPPRGAAGRPRPHTFNPSMFIFLAFSSAAIGFYMLNAKFSQNVMDTINTTLTRLGRSPKVSFSEEEAKLRQDWPLAELFIPLNTVLVEAVSLSEYSTQVLYQSNRIENLVNRLQRYDENPGADPLFLKEEQEALKVDGQTINRFLKDLYRCTDMFNDDSTKFTYGSQFNYGSQDLTHNDFISDYEKAKNSWWAKDVQKNCEIANTNIRNPNNANKGLEIALNDVQERARAMYDYIGEQVEKDKEDLKDKNLIGKVQHFLTKRLDITSQERLFYFTIYEDLCESNASVEDQLREAEKSLDRLRQGLRELYRISKAVSGKDSQYNKLITSEKEFFAMLAHRYAKTERKHG